MAFSHIHQDLLKDALRSGGAGEIQAAIQAGASVQYFEDEHGYDALQVVCMRAHSLSDAELTAIIRLLAAHQARLDGQPHWHASALNLLSSELRFQGVQALLEVGSPEHFLAWTPLCREVALGTLDSIRACLHRHPDDLETQDGWSRTPYTLAVALGRLDVAKMLLDAGANGNATDHVGRLPLFHAVKAGRWDTVRWLLDRGTDVDATDRGGSTALRDAVDADDHTMAALLLAAGADPNHPQVGFSCLGSAVSRDMAALLLAAGADPAELRHEQQCLFLSATVSPAEPHLAAVTRGEFERHHTRAFGGQNPQPMQFPFWLAMVRSGLTAYHASKHFGALSRPQSGPVWCANRHGQSLTLIADGRAVQIGGEHEDHYDPDFCIYNDVFVHHPDGRLEIYGYPQTVFPPTDFHTATLVGERIIVIGGLGYAEQRRHDRTQVFALSLNDWRMARLTIEGPGPGWIFKHRATLDEQGNIVIQGGHVLTMAGGEETQTLNDRTWVLDLAVLRWRHISL